MHDIFADGSKPDNTAQQTLKDRKERFQTIFKPFQLQEMGCYLQPLT